MQINIYVHNNIYLLITKCGNTCGDPMMVFRFTYSTNSFGILFTSFVPAESNAFKELFIG